MDAEEINGLLWDLLAQSPTPLRPDQLALESGQPLLAVQSALARLRRAALIEPADQQVPPAYRAVLDLDALRWAQAVGMGVELLSLERHARLSQAGRAQALRLATDGSLERIEEKARTSKRQQRDATIRGRAASRAAATDLAQILKDTQAACARTEAARPGDARSRVVAQLLSQANQEAQRALDDLVKSLAAR